MLQSAKIILPRTTSAANDVIADVEERLMRIGDGGEISCAPAGDEYVITMLAEMPERTRLSEAKIRAALPSALRHVAAITLAEQAKQQDDESACIG